MSIRFVDVVCIFICVVGGGGGGNHVCTREGGNGDTVEFVLC